MNLTNILTLVSLGLKILPDVMRAIKDMEGIIPAAKLGIVKKALIEKVLSDMLGIAGSNFPEAGLDRVIAVIPQMVGKMIDTGVSFYNMLGIFSSPKRIDPKEFGLSQADVDAAKKSLETTASSNTTVEQPVSGVIKGIGALLIIPLMLGAMSINSCSGMKRAQPTILADTVVYEGSIGVGEGETAVRVRTACSTAIVCAEPSGNTDPNVITMPQIRLMDNASQDANAVPCGGVAMPYCNEPGMIILPLTVDDSDISKACIQYFIEAVGWKIDDQKKAEVMDKCSGRLKLDDFE